MPNDRDTTTAPQNSGHGHVRPRPDGVKARCGGPGLCQTCAQEAAALAAAPSPVPAQEPGPRLIEHTDGHLEKTRDRERADLARHLGHAVTPLYAAPAASSEGSGPAAQGATSLPSVITDAPERIWLDLGFDPHLETPSYFRSLEGATWSEDSAASEEGVEYVRADLVAPAVRNDAAQRLEAFGHVLQRVGILLGLPAGSDVTKDILPAMHAFKDRAAAPVGQAEDAARYRWLRATTNWVSSNGERIDVRNNPALWDAAIDASIARAQQAVQPQPKPNREAANDHSY